MVSIRGVRVCEKKCKISVPEVWAKRFWKETLALLGHTCPMTSREMLVKALTTRTFMSVTNHHFAPIRWKLFVPSSRARFRKWRVRCLTTDSPYRRILRAEATNVFLTVVSISYAAILCALKYCTRYLTKHWQTLIDFLFINFRLRTPAVSKKKYDRFTTHALWRKQGAGERGKVRHGNMVGRKAAVVRKPEDVEINSRRKRNSSYLHPKRIKIFHSLRL